MSELPITAEQTAAAAEAQVVHERIQRNVGQMRHLWITLAGDLFTFNDRELWRALGYGSWNAYLASPEIQLDRRWVFELTAVYRELVVNRQVEPEKLGELNVSAVREVLPAIRRGHKTVDEALADAEVLGAGDLRDRYRAMTVRPPNDPEPPLDAGAEPAYTTCPACGSRLEVRS